MTHVAPERIDDLLRDAVNQLTLSGSDSPSLDAAVLLCHVLQKPRSYLLTWPEKKISMEQNRQFSNLLYRRQQGEPIAYIVGTREFWSLPLKVSPATLIPRPETECLVEYALGKASTVEGAILDLGTGTGAIALAVASELPNRQLIGVDLHPEACALAEENAERLGIQNVSFKHGSWFEPIQSGTKFALILSNPPYIDSTDPHLSQGDVRFEPRSALVAEEHGLADIRVIATQAREFLVSGGWLLFEHGFQQADAVQALLKSLGFQHVHTIQDDAEQPRVTAGCYSEQ